MNPWTSIWFHPRQTVRGIVDTNPKRLVLFLALSAGAAEWLINGLGVLIGLRMSLVSAMLLCIALGALLGWIGLYVMGWLYRWVGSWLGGQATNVEVRAALAWVKVPTFALFGIWLALLLMTKGEGLQGSDVASPSSAVALSNVIYFLASATVGIWSLVLICHALGEVHRFSAWKGFGTVLIPNALFMIPVAVISLLAAIAIPNLLRARHNANETAAIATLKTISAAMTSYREAQSTPRYTTLDVLANANPPYIVMPMTGLDIERYGYTFRHVAPSTADAYCVEAIPQQPGTTGTRIFSVDKEGIVRSYSSGAGCVGTAAAPGGTQVD